MAGKEITKKEGDTYLKAQKTKHHKNRKGVEFKSCSTDIAKCIAAKKGRYLVAHKVTDSKYYGGWDSVMLGVVEADGTHVAYFQRGKPTGD